MWLFWDEYTGTTKRLAIGADCILIDSMVPLEG